MTLLEKLERQPNSLRVLTYHRVDYPDAQPDLDPNLISAIPEDFARQMEHLAEHCLAVKIDQVVQAVRDKTLLPPRSVLVTFDDAYRDFAEHAWPILKRMGLPVVMFVPTAFPGQPRQFWWDTVYEALHKGKVDRDLGNWGIEVFSNETRAQTYRRVVRELKMLPHDEVLARVAELSRQSGLSAVLQPSHGVGRIEEPGWPGTDTWCPYTDTPVAEPRAAGIGCRRGDWGVTRTAIARLRRCSDFCISGRSIQR